MRLIRLFDIISETALVERRKFRQPQIMYHGTSSAHLRGILKQGVLPSAEEKVWQDDPHISASDFSRASLEGSYWTTNLMTARASSTTAANKFGGSAIIVIAQIAEASTFADEDSITTTIQRALPEAFNSVVEEGHRVIPEAAIKSAALNYFSNGAFYRGFQPEDLFQGYAKILHESLAGDAKREPMDLDLMRRMMEAHMMRQLAYENEASGNKYYQDQFVKEMLRLAEEGKVPPIPPLAEVENTIKGLQDELTRKYRKTTRADTEMFNPTLRITTPVTFRGANKIICVIGEMENWKEQGYENSYSTPLVLYYGTPPPIFLKQHEERIGEFRGAVNPQGEMVIPPRQRAVNEAPIADIQTHGMEQEPMSMPAPDVKMLTNPKYWNTVKKKWSNTVNNYILVFANLDLGELTAPRPEGEKYSGSATMKFTKNFQNLLSNYSGAVDPEVMQNRWGMDIQPTPGVITVVFLSNADASTISMRMTPWIMAHRLGHSVIDELQSRRSEFGAVERFDDIVDFLDEHYSESSRIEKRLSYDEEYHRDLNSENNDDDHAEIMIGHGPDREMELHYSIPYEQLLTMKTARTQTMRPGEHLPELIAQFIMQGKVTLARAIPPKDEDDLVVFSNGSEMDDHYISWNGQKEAEWMNERIEQVEAETNEYLTWVFEQWETAGTIFVAP